MKTVLLLVLIAAIRVLIMEFGKSVIVVTVLLCSSVSLGQDFLDDFEDGDIAGWTVVVSWDVLGNNEIANEHAHLSQYSMRMWRSSWPHATIVRRDEFLAAEGYYHAWFYIAGSWADGYMLIHHMDDDNFYVAQCHPLGGDSPRLDLIKKVNGDATTIASVPANFSLYEWVKLTVRRGDPSEGIIEVRINDVTRISVIDTELQEPGGFCVGSWENTFVDDVSYNLDSVGTVESSWGKVKSLYR